MYRFLPVKPSIGTTPPNQYSSHHSFHARKRLRRCIKKTLISRFFSTSLHKTLIIRVRQYDLLFTRLLAYSVCIISGSVTFLESKFDMKHISPFSINRRIHPKNVQRNENFNLLSTWQIVTKNVCFIRNNTLLRNTSESHLQNMEIRINSSYFHNGKKLSKFQNRKTTGWRRQCISENMI